MTAQARRAHRRNVFLSYRPDRRTVILSAIALGTLMLVTTAFFLFEYLSNPDRFPVRTIRFDGPFERVTEAQLKDSAIPYVRGNFFLLDLDAVRTHIEALPWIRSAAVRRQWPQGVQVYFTEQRLVAHWGAHLWLNDDGEIVDLQDAATPEGLPQLNGPENTQVQVLAHYRQLNAIATDIGLDIARLNLSPRRSWQLSLSNGLSVLLGRADAEQRFARFAAVYRDTVAQRLTQVGVVDLRYTNGFSVHWARYADAPAARAPHEG